MRDTVCRRRSRVTGAFLVLRWIAPVPGGDVVDHRGFPRVLLADGEPAMPKGLTVGWRAGRPVQAGGDHSRIQSGSIIVRCFSSASFWRATLHLCDRARELQAIDRIAPCAVSWMCCMFVRHAAGPLALPPSLRTLLCRFHASLLQPPTAEMASNSNNGCFKSETNLAARRTSWLSASRKPCRTTAFFRLGTTYALICPTSGRSRSIDDQ